MALLKSGLPCDHCGSSDAASIYRDEDADRRVCFSCQHTKVIGERKQMSEAVGYKDGTEALLQKYIALWQKHSGNAIPKRGLFSATVKHYGVVVEGDVVAFPYFEPDKSTPSAFKVKHPDRWQVVGDMKNCMLFGQQSVGNHNQSRVVLVEGEWDALAAAQMFDFKVPVVSIKNGAAAARKDIENYENYNFLDGFQEIVICFDPDDAGNAGVEKVAEVFAGKLRVLSLDARVGDINDYLQASRTQEFVKKYWAADLFTPEGVYTLEDMREILSKAKEEAVATYPWPLLQKMLEGLHSSQLITLCAGSGLGKTAILREIMMHVWRSTEETCGALFMEEAPKRTIEGFMSIDLSTPLHLSHSTVKHNSPEYWESFDRVYGDGRMAIMGKSFDTAVSVDEVVSRVRFLIKARGCKLVAIDHVSILVSAGQHNDERKALDEIMTKLRTLSADTGAILLIVSHLKRPDGKAHEEGAVTSVSQLRGSAAIAQLSDAVIGAERNGQHEDVTERNTTYTRVLKNRHSGVTGPADALLYDHETGRLTVAPEKDPEEIL